MKIQKPTAELYVYRQCVGVKRLMHQKDIFQYTEVKHTELYVNNSNCNTARARQKSGRLVVHDKCKWQTTYITGQRTSHHRSTGSCGIPVTKDITVVNQRVA